MCTMSITESFQKWGHCTKVCIVGADRVSNHSLCVQFIEWEHKQHQAQQQQQQQSNAHRDVYVLSSYAAHINDWAMHPVNAMHHRDAEVSEISDGLVVLDEIISPAFFARDDITNHLTNKVQTKYGRILLSSRPDICVTPASAAPETHLLVVTTCRTNPDLADTIFNVFLRPTCIGALDDSTYQHVRDTFLAKARALDTTHAFVVDTLSEHNLADTATWLQFEYERNELDVIAPFPKTGGYKRRAPQSAPTAPATAPSASAATAEVVATSDMKRPNEKPVPVTNVVPTDTTRRTAEEKKRKTAAVSPTSPRIAPAKLDHDTSGMVCVAPDNPSFDPNDLDNHTLLWLTLRACTGKKDTVFRVLSEFVSHNGDYVRNAWYDDATADTDCTLLLQVQRDMRHVVALNAMVAFERMQQDGIVKESGLYFKTRPKTNT